MPLSSRRLASSDCQLANLVIAHNREDFVVVTILNPPGAFDQSLEPGHHSVRHDQRQAEADKRGEPEHNHLDND